MLWRIQPASVGIRCGPVTQEGEGEDNHLGPHVFGRGHRFVENLAQLEENNRTLMMEFLQNTESRAMNSFFDKPTSKKPTYIEKETVGKGPPFSPIRYAEIDHVVARTHTCNSVLDVESRTELEFPSDHFPIFSRIRFKLKKQCKAKDESNEWRGAL